MLLLHLAVCPFLTMPGRPTPIGSLKSWPQPATRVGPGAAQGGAGQSTQFIGCATFPIALCNQTTSNTNFLTASQSNQTNYTVDILPNKKPRLWTTSRRRLRKRYCQWFQQRQLLWQRSRHHSRQSTDQLNFLFSRHYTNVCGTQRQWSVAAS